MDPSTRLDHAVFQLTPTRTRCDLLVFSGKGVNEKIASGLLEPFLSHLRSAREQIPKGGYSFTLRPPPQAARGSPSSGGARGDDAAAGSAPTTTTTADWFTKGTLDRFVRFVKTPDILERVAAIEKEIAHIESCFHQPEDDPATTTTTIHAAGAGAGGTAKAENQGSASRHGRGDDDNSNRKLLSPSSKPRADASNTNGHDAAATHAENASKLCLQQTLETRKAVLLKEQGMAYARATVAGYDMPNLDDLVSFADVFGASRLREACINFKDICEKKEKDKIWMDELAAIEAFHRHTNHDHLLEAVTAGHHLESINCAFSDTVTTDPIIAAASSVDAGQDSSGNTPNREPWTSANNGIYHDKYQIPIGWPGRHPPYMYNFQNPAQQMPPYQGYVFPAAFPTCPPPGHEFDNIAHQQPPPPPPPFKQVSDGKPGQKKAAARRTSTSTTTTTTSGSGNVGERSHDSSSSRSESDGQTVLHGADASDQEDDDLGKGQHHKRSNKKSSRTVVIRNLNYISSERRSRGGEDGSTSSSSVSSVEGDIVENIVDSLKNYHRASRHQHKKEGKSKSRRRRHNVQEEDDDNCFGQINDADIGANAEVISSAAKGDEISWTAFQRSILMRDDDDDDDESSPTDDQLSGKNNYARVQSDHGNEQQGQFNEHSGDDDGGGDQIKNNGAELATSASARRFPVLETQTLKGGCRHRSLDATDPIAANHDKDGDDEEEYNNKTPSRTLGCDENCSTRSMKRRSDYVDEECMFSGKTDSEINVIISGDHDVTGCASETLTAPNHLQRDAGFFFTVSDKPDPLQGGEGSNYTAQYSNMFEGDRHHHLKKYCSDGVVMEDSFNPAGDDSFIIVAATRPGGGVDHEHPASHWDTDDVGIIQGLELVSTHDEVGGAGVGAGHDSTGNISGRVADNYHEPDDLQMVLLQRSTAGSDGAASWAPEIDYTFHVAGGSDPVSTHEAKGCSAETPDLNTNTNNNNSKGAAGEGSPRRRKPSASKDHPKSKSMVVNGSLTGVKPPPVVPSRNRKPSAMSREEIQRNKMLQEEENRKRIEGLLVQRQKRIAERSSGGSTTSLAMARVIGATTESKLGTGSSIIKTGKQSTSTSFKEIIKK